MSPQSQYVIGLYGDVNPTKTDVATILGAHWVMRLVILIISAWKIPPRKIAPYPNPNLNPNPYPWGICWAVI